VKILRFKEPPESLLQLVGPASVEDRTAVNGWTVPENLPADPLMQIAFWLRRERLTTEEVVAAIEAARNSGLKWWEIGASMGRTSEAARAYYHYHRKWDG